MTPLAAALLPIFGFAVGVALAKWTNRSKPVLDKGERRELDSLRTMEENLSVAAAEHSMLGDNFAVIVAETIREHRQSLRSNR